MSLPRWVFRAAPWAFAAAFACTGPARADDSAATQRQADERFQEGKALLAQGDVTAACQKFEQSLALLRRGGTLLNLAVCREKEGKQATAMRLYQEALNVALTDKRPDREKLARERLAEVRTKVSWLEIKPPEGAAAPGFSVRCDDEILGPDSLGAPMAYDAGTHRIVASAAGYAPYEASVTLATPGEHRTVTLPPLTRIEAPSPTATASATAAATGTAAVTGTVAPAQSGSLGAPPTATLAPSAAPGGDLGASPSAWRKPLGITGLALGVAGLAVGVAGGVKAIVDNDATKRLCPNDRCSTSEGISRNQDARVEALMADIALPVGIVAAGAGLVLLLTSRGAPPEKSARVSVVPDAGPRGGSLSVRGAW